MLNDFGKLIRKFRIDNNIKLGEMALSLKVTPAYLSSVEHSKKKLNQDFVNRIATGFGFTPTQQHEVRTVGAKVIGEVTIRPTVSSDLNLEATLMFARSVEESTLSEEKAKQILDILKM